jgi:ERCC4 domain/Lsr2
MSRVELLIARNPDEASTLPYLLRLPIAGGLVFRVKDTWPRTNAIFCYPVSTEEWPTSPDLVERVALRVCERRGAAIDVVADRGREQRSQIVYTHARGREMVFWQSPRTRKQSRPQVRVPTARAAGIAEMEILVDAHERYPYTFSGQQVRTVKKALPCGDYGVTINGTLVAAVERKSLSDLMSSVTSGRLRYAMAELAGLPRAAVVVEDLYPRIFAQTLVRPAVIAVGLAELQVRVPGVPIVFCDSRKLAEEWTYRWLGAAYAWALDELPAVVRVGTTDLKAGAPNAAELRDWARANGWIVSDRGRVPAAVLEAWQTAQVDR